MAKILLVEDNPKLAQQVKVWLEYEHHVVELATDGGEALDRLRLYHFDLVVLDWMLPGMEGVDVCRRLRERGMKIPILMLSGRETVMDKATGLEYGADDYVTKPVAPNELSARIRALLRRAPAQQEAPLELGDLFLDKASLTVRKGALQVSLQAQEIRLLELFVRHPNELLSAEYIIENVWGRESDASSNLLKSYVNKLRSKFKDCEQPLEIKAVYGQGYILKHKD